MKSRIYLETGYDECEERRQTERRLVVLRLIALTIFSLFVARLYWMQVVNHETYAEMAVRNRLRRLPIKAPRGRILDRNGVALAASKPSYNIVVSNEDLKGVEEEIKLIGAQLGIDRKWLTRRFEEAKYEPKYLPIVLKEDASPTDVAWIVAHQFEYEEQADLSPTGRGAIAVMNPHNGEILAMVSRPAFDPNLFSRRAKSPDDKEETHDLYEDENRPLFNRVIQGAYPTGSTWKIFMAVAALNEGVVTVEDSKIKDGGLWIGNYWMSSLSNLGHPDIHLAIVKSADGYFYRLGLRMGIERIEKWADLFRLGQRTGVDLPNERAGIPPSRDWKAKVNPKDPLWRDYDTAAAAIGQGIAITPLQMLRMVAGVAVGGKMATPHLLLERAAGIDRFGNEQPEVRYTDEKKFDVPMSLEIHETVTRAMWSVVNENGAGARARRRLRCFGQDRHGAGRVEIQSRREA